MNTTPSWTIQASYSLEKVFVMWSWFNFCFCRIWGLTTSLCTFCVKISHSTYWLQSKKLSLAAWSKILVWTDYWISPMQTCSNFLRLGWIFDPDYWFYGNSIDELWTNDSLRNNRVCRDEGDELKIQRKGKREWSFHANDTMLKVLRMNYEVNHLQREFSMKRETKNKLNVLLWNTFMKFIPKSLLTIPMTGSHSTCN